MRAGDAAGSFVGINVRCANGKTAFLPRMLIRERLEQYQILTNVFFYASSIYDLIFLDYICCKPFP